MKRLFTILTGLLFLFIVSAVLAQDIKDNGKKPLIILSNQERIKPKETLVYVLKWLGMDVGKIVLRMEGFKNIYGHKCYHITACAIPNAFLNGIWNLDYNVHSYVDYLNLTPIRFERIKRINKEFSHTIIDFNHTDNRIEYLSEELELTTLDTPVDHKINLKPITDEVPSATQDLLSIFYYFRFKDIQENSQYAINIYYDQKNWPVEIKTKKAFLKQIGDKGEFLVIKVISDSKLNDHLFGGDESVFFLTSDSRHIPLEFKFDTALGTVTGIIQDIPQ